MAPHSSTVARKIPWTEEPGRLQSMGSLRVRHDWASSLSLSTFMHWRRKWQPTPVFLPGESHGRRSLVGCSPRGHTESDTTEAMQQQQIRALIAILLVIILHVFTYAHTTHTTLTALSLYFVLLFSCEVVQLFAVPWTITCQAPLSMKFSKQE